LREKVRRGEYPGPAPIGYINDYRTKRVFVDRERAPVVKEAFERYATGGETQETLRVFFGKQNVHSRTGKLLGNTTISSLLSNPMFYGHFRYRGEVHEGKHEPIISKKLFDEVQAVINERWRYSPKEQKNPRQRRIWGFSAVRPVAVPSQPRFRKATPIIVAQNEARPVSVSSRMSAKKPWTRKFQTCLNRIHSQRIGRTKC
jgi:hypothetical protein